MLDRQAVAERLRALLTAHAEELVGHLLALTEQDIKDGWRAFYTSEVWMREHLPEPLINALGRAYMAEQLRQRIALPFGELNIPMR